MGTLVYSWTAMPPKEGLLSLYTNTLQIHHQCGFITVGEFMASQTIGPYLMGKDHLFHLYKTESLEKAGDISEGKHPAQPQRLGLVKTYLNQPRAKTFILGVFGDGQRSDLSQVFPTYAQSAYAINPIPATCPLQPRA